MSNEHQSTLQQHDHGMSTGGAGNGQTRILARQLARPLTDEEMEMVVGGLAMSGTCSAGTCRTPDCDD